MSSQGGTSANLWDIAVEQQKKIVEGIERGNADSSNISSESHLLFCGSKDSGKSSLILRFLDRDEPPKPTVALDFCYGKKSKQNSMTGVKDTSHIWELGGGSSMSKLIDTVITVSNIRKLSVVLVLDLSKPNKIWETQDILLNQIKRRIQQVITDNKKTDQSLEKDLKQLAWDRVGTNHVDKNLITPLLVPLLIIGGKFDLYQELSMDKRQLILKTIRFLSHTNGGMLQFYSSKGDGGRSKMALSHLAFKTPLSKSSSLDSNKPIIVPYGLDSLEQIGGTDRARSTAGRSSADQWRDAFLRDFPSEREEKEKKNPTADAKYADELIDNIRTQKDQELDRYRKISERKAREAQVNAEVGKKAKKTKTR